MIFRSFGILLVPLAFVAVAAACGSDPTVQPSVNLESLTMTANTTGKEVMDRVSEAEGGCLRTSLGAADYEAFLGAELLTAFGQVGDLDPLSACLIPDNFVVFGVAFTAARAGVTDVSHTCLIALGREHPDAVVAFLGIETPPEAEVASSSPCLHLRSGQSARSPAAASKLSPSSIRTLWSWPRSAHSTPQ